MAQTTKQDIRDWLDRANLQRATHVIVMCDTFDYEDYPIFVKEGEDVKEAITKASGSMQRLMEVYDLSKDVEPQLNAYRAGAGVFF